jgi:hypothetical protein
MWWESQKEGSPRSMWVDNINVDLGELGWGELSTVLVWLRIGTIRELL